MADNEVKVVLKPEDAGLFASIKELQSSFEGVGSAISSVVDLAIDAVEKIKQLEQEVRQMRLDFEQAAVSITKASSSLGMRISSCRTRSRFWSIGRPETNWLSRWWKRRAAPVN
jgi:hypothetical protein